MSLLVRKSRKSDCESLAHITTVSWNETYPNIVSDEFLKSLYETESVRAEKSKEQFDSKNNHKYVLEIDKKIVGFVDVCPATISIKNSGEIKALYLLKDYQKNGYGKLLFKKGVEEIRKMGFQGMIISCLEGNPTNDFYEYMGGKLIDKRLFKLPNQELSENIYYFDLEEQI